jgi:hypothetical protein
VSQKDQVLNALKKLKGTGTNTDILNIIDVSKWKTKTPDATISSCLYTLSNEKLCKKVGKYWILIKNAKPQILTKSADDDAEDGLYLITLSSQTKGFLKGFPFKVGSATGGIGKRVKHYNTLLPYISIQDLSTYRVPTILRKRIKEIEKQVRIKLLNNSNLGFCIETCYTGGQTEWLQVTDTSMNEEKISSLVKAFKKATKETIMEFTN